MASSSLFSAYNLLAEDFVASAAARAASEAMGQSSCGVQLSTTKGSDAYKSASAAEGGGGGGGEVPAATCSSAYR
jgi:hypothetical protein